MSAGTLAAAAVFNLLCTGQLIRYSAVAAPGAGVAETLQTIITPRPTGETRPFSMEYRVDLRRKRWCFDRLCDVTFAFDKVSQVELLLDTSADPVRGPRTAIDRETGGYLHRVMRVGGFDEVRGKCIKRRSPGLPSPQF